MDTRHAESSSLEPGSLIWEPSAVRSGTADWGHQTGHDDLHDQSNAHLLIDSGGEISST